MQSFRLKHSKWSQKLKTYVLLLQRAYPYTFTVVQHFKNTSKQYMLWQLIFNSKLPSAIEPNSTHQKPMHFHLATALTYSPEGHVLASEKTSESALQAINWLKPISFHIINISLRSAALLALVTNCLNLDSSVDNNRNTLTSHLCFYFANTCALNAESVFLWFSLILYWHYFFSDL